jgi:ATP-dependent DNA helicase RecQ
MKIAIIFAIAMQKNYWLLLSTGLDGNFDPMSHDSLKILKSVFGYNSFRPLQEEIIANVLRKQDALVIMPTGGGKSICYQIPALIFQGLTVVVSPLISLMKDQVEQLAALGVTASVLNSSLTREEYRENAERVRTGKTHLLYVAPESLMTEGMLALLSSVKLDCLTIDEAHCISEWGHDFRPEYRQLIQVRKRFPDAVCIALTATATPRVRDDIKTSLGFLEGSEYLASFNRPNLFLEVVPKQDPLRQTIEVIEKFPNQSGIIYCFSRRQVDDLTAALSARGYSVRPYHAGLEDEVRHKNQEDFVRDDVQIIVATIAFGMGINKPNVRFVVHFDLPKNIESYYQEIGRAGRDGLPAHCRLLFSASDIVKIRYFLNQKPPHEQRIANAHLQALVGFVETPTCRRQPLMTYFGEVYNDGYCGACDNCLEPSKLLEDLTIPAQKFLSCVIRTGERFGAGHVVDVLLGSQNAKVLSNGHEKLTTYGIGKEHNKQAWMRLARLLVQQGYLKQEPVYQTLSLTASAMPVLRGQEQVHGVMRELVHKEKGVREVVNHDPVLFERLRAKRKEMADLAGVPPYIIFNDRSLIEMSTSFPLTDADLLNIYGVGRGKLQQFGAAFLEEIQAYCLEFGIQGGLKIENVKEPELVVSSRKLRHVVVGEEFQAGKSLIELCETYNVKQGTIIDHLEKFAGEGNRLPVEAILALSSVPAERQQAVIDCFGRSGSALRPVFDEMQGAVSFEELRILRLYLLCREQAALY